MSCEINKVPNIDCGTSFPKYETILIIGNPSEYVSIEVAKRYAGKEVLIITPEDAEKMISEKRLVINNLPAPTPIHAVPIIKMDIDKMPAKSGQESRRERRKAKRI